MRKELTVLHGHLRSKGLRQTRQRERILDIFLSTERHVSAAELYELVKRADTTIGYTTVYRALRLFAACGLASAIDVGDGIARFEHQYEHRHHDHLICTRCGALIEVVDSRIERMQEAMARRHRFAPSAHTLEIFGICGRCARGARKKGR